MIEEEDELKKKLTFEQQRALTYGLTELMEHHDELMTELRVAVSLEECFLAALKYATLEQATKRYVELYEYLWRLEDKLRRTSYGEMTRNIHF